VIKWHCGHSADLGLRSWPDGGVIYNDSSGNFHALTAVGSEVVALLLDGSQWSAAQLVESLLGEGPGTDDIEMMENLLGHLHSLQLISKTTA
jgi:PqqD family protein of HPr-rel-A system